MLVFAFKSFKRQSFREYMQMKPELDKLKLIYCKNWIQLHALKNIEKYSGKISPYSLNSDQEAF